MTGATFLAKTLKANGMDTVFGIPSYVGIKILSALKEEGFDIILNSHEQNAAHMAEGYFYATGKVAVVSLAIGPGVTNAITGIANAYCESIPMIILAGRAATNWWGRNEYHAQSGIGRTIKEKQLVEACTKGAYYPNTEEELVSNINQAIERTYSGRQGPIYISIPQELQKADLKITEVVEYKGKEINPVNKLVERQFSEIYSRAKKPIWLFGGEIEEKVKSTLGNLLNGNCPYITSYAGKGKVPIHPNYLGTLWYCNSSQIIDVIEQADLLVVAGDHLTHFTSRLLDGLKNNLPIIQISQYSDELGRVLPIKLGVEANVSNFLDKLILDKKPWGESEAKKNSSNDQYSTLAVINKLANLAPRETVFFGDVGNAGYAAITDLVLGDGQKFYTTGKLGVCGWSVPTAMGYAYANKNVPVVSIIGDLSFFMNCQELINSDKLGTNNLYLVFNNGVPQNITQDQILELGGTIQADMAYVDYEKIALGYGLEYFRVKSLVDLEKLFNCSQVFKKPMLAEIIVAKDDYPLD